MKLPKQISIIVKNNLQQGIENIIVCLKVKSGRKNPYYIYFPKTNKKGTAILTEEDFIGQFKDHWEMGLMDYNGDIASANPNVELSLFDLTWLIENKQLALAWSLFKHGKIKWKTREEQYEYLFICHTCYYVYYYGLYWHLCYRKNFFPEQFQIQFGHF